MHQDALPDTLASLNMALDTARRLFAGRTACDGSPYDVITAAENIRHFPEAWGIDLDVPLPTATTLPAHVELFAKGAAEGVILSAVCHCGARRELLLDSRFEIGLQPLDPTDDRITREIHKAARHLASGWARGHVNCPSAYELPHRSLADRGIGEDLLSVAQQIATRRLAEILGGATPRLRVGIVIPHGDGYDAITFALGKADPTDITDGITLGEAQFGLREHARQRGAEPVAAFLLAPWAALGANARSALEDEWRAEFGGTPLWSSERASFTVATPQCTAELVLNAGWVEGAVRVAPTLLGFETDSARSPVTGLLARAFRPRRAR